MMEIVDHKQNETMLRELAIISQRLANLESRSGGALRPRARAEPETVPLTLRFVPKRERIQIIWEADVLGQRTSLFRSPYDGNTLLLVIKALDAAQWAQHPLEGPKFDVPERKRLTELGLWEGDRILGDIDKRVGQKLYEALLNDTKAKKALGSARDDAEKDGLALSYVLRYPPGAPILAALPWELLWDENQALLLSYGKPAPCIRYLDLPQALPPPAPPGSSLRILAVTPKAGVPKEVRAAEQKARTDAWADLIKDGLVEMEELQQTTPAGLLDRIQDDPPIDIVHFYGRGRYQIGQGGALLFDAADDREVWVIADKLAGLFSTARLVMLHAAQSSMSDDAGLLTGVAPALSAAGVPAVVAMQLTVSDKAATRFAAVVYRSLARGDSIQRAVSQGRQALYVDDSSWFVPTLTIRSRNTGPIHLVQPQH